jgi:hypothetical protein
MRLVILLAAMALGGLLVREVRATSGVCSITDMGQRIRVPIDNPDTIGCRADMPVEFDETAGTFSMSRDAWFQKFSDLGCTYTVFFGSTNAFLRMLPGTSTGTIDAAGNVALPAFPMDFFTDFGGLSPALPMDGMELVSGLAVAETGGQLYTTRGAALDFATGMLTLAGVGVIHNAPGAGGDSVTEVRMTCTLAPIPSAANLPAAPVFKRIRGKAKIDAPGDTLKLTASIGATTPPLPFATAQGAILNLVPDGAAEPLVSARIASFTPSGKKKLVATGDAILLAAGAKAGVESSATVTVKPRRKATGIVIAMAGLDLASLSGGVTLELWVDGRGVIGTAAASGETKKKIK